MLYVSTVAKGASKTKKKVQEHSLQAPCCTGTSVDSWRNDTIGSVTLGTGSSQRQQS